MKRLIPMCALAAAVGAIGLLAGGRALAAPVVFCYVETLYGGATIDALDLGACTHVTDAFVLVGNEGVQMHGGIGMTDEHDVGFFLKRARAAEITFGDAAFHRDRVARLDGY